MADNEKVIIVQKTANLVFRTKRIWQYDVGHTLRFDGFNLPYTFEVHFAHSLNGESQKQIGQDGICEVPPEYTQNSGFAYAWLYEVTEDTGLTKHQIEIPIEGRARPTDQEPTPAQQSAIDQTIAASNNALEKTLEAKQAAEDAANSVKNAGATAETLTPGSPATVVVRDVNGVKTFEFGIPEGQKGETGETPNFTVGSVTTLPAGSPVTVTITGTAENPVLNIGIPQGTQGIKGDTGAVPHFTIGTVTTLPPDSQATVTITGTDGNPILNLGIPKGVQGQKGDKGDAFTYADFTEEQKTELIQGPIKTAQDEAIEAVDDEGQRVLDSIPSDYTALAEDVENLEESLEAHKQEAENTYAHKDGYYQEMTAGNAEQLVATEAVEDQEPYHLRPSGGSADIGNRENQKAIVGVSLPWNQLVRDEASDNETEFADIVTVDDAVADNAAVKVKIEPVQDLHGYNSPWPAGGGKNKLQVTYTSGTVNNVAFTVNTDGTITVSGTASATLNRTIGTVTLPAGNYVLNGGISPYLTLLIAGVAESSTSDAAFTLAEETTLNVNVYISSGTAASGTYKPMIRLASETDATFAPYSNECPISGFDKVELWDDPTHGGLINWNQLCNISAYGNGTSYGIVSINNNDGSYSFDGTAEANVNYFPVPTDFTQGHTYLYLIDSSVAITHPPQYVTTKGNRISKFIANTQTVTSSIFITSGTTLNHTIVKPMIFDLTQMFGAGNEPSTVEEFKALFPADYYPYNAGEVTTVGAVNGDPYRHYTVTIPSEAGTIYGAELTVNKDGTGTVVVDSGETVFDGTQDVHPNWQTKENSTAWWYDYSLTNHAYESWLDYIPNFLADVCPVATYREVIIGGNPQMLEIGCYTSATIGVIFRTTNMALTTEEAINAYLSSNPVTLVYKLATPITYTLTAQQVQTLLGTNHVWSDAGQVSLTYTGTNEHLTLTEGRKYLTRISGTDAMVTGAGQEIVAAKGTDNVFDLTKLFGTAVADYVYQQGAGYFRKWFPNSLYEYNPGELVSVEGLQSHDTVGFNIWDEEWESGYYDANGNPVSSTAQVRSKNLISVIPGLQYYAQMAAHRFCYYDASKQFISRSDLFSSSQARLFTIPDNCYYIKFHADQTGGIYNHDICINLSNSGSRNGEYEPYVRHSYPLDSSVVLRGVPKLINGKPGWDGDRYLPDGTVERRYGVVDLGTLNWVVRESASYGTYFYASASGLGIKFSHSPATPYDAVCNKYSIVGRTQNTFLDKTLVFDGTVSAITEIQIKDTAYSDAAAFKAAMSGVYLVYELATPTTETADPYRELQIVDDWGTEEFVSDSLVPIGHETSYPANLRDKLQHLPDLASANGIFLVRQTDSEMELLKLPDMPTANGNYRLKLNIASGSPTFSWEVV